MRFFRWSMKSADCQQLGGSSEPLTIEEAKALFEFLVMGFYYGFDICEGRICFIEPYPLCDPFLVCRANIGTDDEIALSLYVYFQR